MSRPMAAKKAKALRQKCRHRQRLANRRAARHKAQLADLFSVDEVQEMTARLGAHGIELKTTRAALSNPSTVARREANKEGVS